MNLLNHHLGSAQLNPTKPLEEMHQHYPSVQIPIKELRLFLRRINKVVKDLETEESNVNYKVDDVTFSQISSLVIRKATEMKSNSAENQKNDEISEILNELI